MIILTGRRLRYLSRVAVMGPTRYNARSTILGAYHEGGTAPSQPGPRDLILGGLQQGDVDRTRGALIVDDNKWNYLTAYGLRTSPGGGSPPGGTNFTSQVTLGGQGDANETILNINNYEQQTWALQHINGTGPDGVTGRDIVFRDNTGPGKNVITFTTIARRNSMVDRPGIPILMQCLSMI
jgi:hypothetical protein